MKRKGNAKAGKSKKQKPTDALLTAADINNYKSLVLEAPKYYNHINLLEEDLSKRIEQMQDEELADNSIEALTVIFNNLIRRGSLRLSRKQTDSQITVAKWLRAKYNKFQEQIFHLWTKPGLDGAKIVGLGALMTLVKSESDTMAPNEGEPYFANNSYRAIVEALLTTGTADQVQQDCTIDNPLILEFYESYFDKYWDVKFFLFDINVTREMVSNLLTLVKPHGMYPDDEEEAEEYVSKTLATNPPSKIDDPTKFGTVFEKCWLTLLQQDLSVQQIKAVLTIFHRRIVPYCNNPTRFMDFLTAAYDMGTEGPDVSVAILALNGLWELMKADNLDYPDFYIKLYAILTPELLHLSYRSRFFRMLDLFLGSTHISAAVVASFLKRLARLSLTAPPAGIIAVVPFTYNLLKKHPSCMVLIHSTEEFDDKFDEKEADPAKTHALESSLWELEVAMHHYHPQVASLGKILSQPFQKESYNIEDFLDWTYEKLVDAETRKKYKGELSTEYERWDKLYGEGGYMELYRY